MNLHERILKAARALAAEKPVDRITFADIARASGVSGPTVRRYLGTKEHLRELLWGEPDTGNHPGTRPRIISAAARVFALYGFSGATLDEVAAQAGVTKGAVYWHFTSKSDLYLALLEERVGQEAERLPLAIRSAAAIPDPEQALSMLLGTQFEAAYSEPERPRLSIDFLSRSWDPEVRERLSAIYRGAHEKLAKALEQLQQEGLLAADIDPLVFSVFLTAMIEGLVRLWLIGPDWVDLKAWTPRLAHILWKGVEP